MEQMLQDMLQDLRDLHNGLIRPIVRFLWWPWAQAVKGLKKDAPDFGGIAALIDLSGITLQVLSVLSMLDRRWRILLALAIIYWLVTLLHRKKLKKEPGVAGI